MIAKSKYSISLNRVEPDGEINDHSGKKDAINLIDARHPMLGEDGVPLS